MSGVDLVKKRVLERVPLAELIGETVDLQLKSGRPVGLCPFHSEKSASFNVYAKNFHCFGCKASGDAIHFVRESQGMGFIESLRYLCRKYSIPCDELDEAKRNKNFADDEAKLFKAMLAAQNHFVDNLNSPQGSVARAYLDKRGFNAASIKEFGFGLALDDYQALGNVLQRNAVQVDVATKLSLVKMSEKTRRPYDFFRHKLMIPIRDYYGRVIGFGGRRMGEDGPKYINSAETPLFDKGSVLFGFDRAREHIRKNSRALIAEGYMDVLQLWHQGVGEVVACMGTALTLNHLRSLKHATKNVIMVLDGDVAGEKGAMKAVGHALEVPEVDLKVAIMPPGEDPDTYIREFGVESFQKLLDNAVPILEFAINVKLKNCGNDAAIPDMVGKEFLQWVVKTKDPIKQAFLLNKIAETTKIPLTALKASMRKAHAPKPQEQPPAPEHEPLPLATEQAKMVIRDLGRIERELISHLYFASPNELEPAAIKQIIIKELDMDDVWNKFALELIGCLEMGKAPKEQQRSSWVCSLIPEVIMFMESLQEKAAAFETDHRKDMIEKLLLIHRVNHLKEQMKAMRIHLTNDPNDLDALTLVSSINQKIKVLELQLKS